MFRVKKKSSRLVQHPEKNINIAVSNVDVLSVQRLVRDGVDTNVKDTDGRTPLHYAVISGNIDIVNILLENGADVTQANDHGDTPLHAASSKGHIIIVDVMLRHIGREKLNCFVNAKSFYSGTTALHLAAKSGSLDVVKSLLKHGATYNSGNIEDLAPIDLAKDMQVTTLLQLVDELFKGAKNGNVETVVKLKAAKPDELPAFLNTRNREGHTLLQVAVANRHKDVADQLLNMLKEPNTGQKLPGLKCELDQLKEIVNAIKLHFRFSMIYLPMVRSMSLPYDSEKNTAAWKCLKEGSYYLGNAFNAVKKYKECVPGPINDVHIQLANYTLIELEFDRKHISSGHIDGGGDGIYFISKGQGTKYYSLLHSESKKDVRSFINMVEQNIEEPLMKFMISAERILNSPCSEKLTPPIKADNTLAGESKNKKHTVLREPDNAQKLPSSEHDLDQLKYYLELHFRYSKLPDLRTMSIPHESEKNHSPWRTLKEGSYYLANASDVVKVYKRCVPGQISNIDIQLVNDTLVALEFDTKHISSGFTDEAYGGEVECFVSKGQGAKYYNLLHSESKRDVRSFIEMAELNIDKPLDNFLHSINRSLDLGKSFN